MHTVNTSSNKKDLENKPCLESMNKELKFLQYGKISLGTTLKEKGAGVLMGKFFSLVYCGFFFFLSFSAMPQNSQGRKKHISPKSSVSMGSYRLTSLLPV